jgi:hypothetical protein
MPYFHRFVTEKSVRVIYYICKINNTYQEEKDDYDNYAFYRRQKYC